MMREDSCLEELNIHGCGGVERTLGRGVSGIRRRNKTARGKRHAAKSSYTTNEEKETRHHREID